MSQLPLNIEVAGRKILVVGGGAVAARKIRNLLAAGADVTAIAKEFLPDLERLSHAAGLRLVTGGYDSSRLTGLFMVVAATDNPAVNQAIADDAKRRNLLVAVADAPESGNCSFPALLKRGSLQIAVSTNGRCPAFAVKVRDRIAELVGEEYAEALDQLADYREKLLTEGNSSTYNAQLIRQKVENTMAGLTSSRETG